MAPSFIFPTAAPDSLWLLFTQHPYKQVFDELVLVDIELVELELVEQELFELELVELELVGCPIVIET